MSDYGFWPWKMTYFVFAVFLQLFFNLYNHWNPIMSTLDEILNTYYDLYDSVEDLQTLYGTNKSVIKFPRCLSEII